MKKIVIDRPGGYEKLELVSTSECAPKMGEVLVEVSAIGINYADCIVRMGLYSSAKKLAGYPITPGFEFAGTITAVGPGVDNGIIGNDVFGLTLFGAYSSHVCVPADQIFPIPSNMSMIQAATFPVVFVTAWYAAIKLAQLSENKRVLIHSAAGGVGSALAQIHRIYKCDITGVVGHPGKVDAALEVGCDRVVAKTDRDHWEKLRSAAPAGFDVIYDSTGMSTLANSFQSIAPMGRLVIFGFHSMLPKTGGKPNYLKLAWNYLRSPRINPMKMTESNKSVMAFNLSFLFDRTDVLSEGISCLLDWHKGSLITPLEVTEYSMANVAQAHKDIESGMTTGKLALIV